LQFTTKERQWFPWCWCVVRKNG